jgi:urea transport system permease protein
LAGQSLGKADLRFLSARHQPDFGNGKKQNKVWSALLTNGGVMLDILFIGLSLGSILLLVALGLAITYGAMGVINMAHGEMVMIGAYVAVLSGIWLKTSLLLAIPLAFVVTALLGLIIERVVVRRLYGRLLDTLLATWGIAILLQQAVRLELGLTFLGIHIEGLGAGLQNVAVPSYLQGTFRFAGADINAYRTFIIAVTAALTLATWFILYRTTAGMQVRAIIRNPKMAAACGIDVKRINAFTFAFGSGLAGVAGVMMSGFKTVFPDMGTTMVVDGFMVVVTGGVGSLFGTALSSGLLGEINALVAIGTNDILARAVVFGVVILVILVKPSGLFSFKGR